MSDAPLRPEVSGTPDPTGFSPAKPPPGGMARPTLEFMMSHPAHFIAMGLGSGLGRIAPGTVGTLWAWLSYLLLQHWFTPPQIGLLISGSIPLGWWACTVMPTGFWGQFIAFALFRFFDAAKPQPVKWADRCFKGFGWRGGWGIMFDDLVAAFCTLLVIALWRHFIG
jgi:phosphatidylglycerophosphatase A